MPQEIDAQICITYLFTIPRGLEEINRRIAIRSIFSAVPLIREISGALTISNNIAKNLSVIYGLGLDGSSTESDQSAGASDHLTN